MNLTDIINLPENELKEYYWALNAASIKLQLEINKLKNEQMNLMNKMTVINEFAKERGWNLKNRSEEEK